MLTPAGNWSSFPPHKHDRPAPGEAMLEEIYYFEIAESERGTGLAYQRVYSSGPDREIDVLAEVRSGDTVLVPHGYHGPSMAAPGHHLYYLNVLAGPAAERSMAFSYDPAHAWIRDSWESEQVDPRLPLTSGRAGGVREDASAAVSGTPRHRPADRAAHSPAKGATGLPFIALPAGSQP